MKAPRYESPWWAPFALIGMGFFLAACCAVCWIRNRIEDIVNKIP